MSPVSALRDVVSAEGSTRPLAIIRIGVVLVLWSEWATRIALFRDHDAASFLIAIVFFAATPAFLLGYRSRLSGWMTAASTAAIVAYVDYARAGIAHHHTLLLALVTLYLAMSPAGRSLSLDRLQALRRGTDVPPERGPLWTQTLIAVQVASIYFWGAVDKSSWTWLRGDRAEIIVMDVFTDFAAPAWPLFGTLTLALAISTTLLEYALAFGLFIPRVRRVLWPLGLAFHGLIYLTLPVSTFSATMFVLYLAFLDPTVVHRVVGELTAPSAER